MITRHRDPDSLMETMGVYRNELKGFIPEEWLAYYGNVCLTDGKGNFTLFERITPGAVYGHYFLKARGREAIALCKEFLREIFTGPYGVEIIQGITPLDKPGALWMNKKLGFESQGIMETIVGPCELVELTKKDWTKRDE